MGLVKKIKKEKAEIKKPAVSKEDKEAVATARRINRQLALVSKKSNLYFMALANIFTIYCLHKHMKMPVKTIFDYIFKFVDKNKCIMRGLADYNGIMNYEIRHTDKEYNPLKWTDYEYPESQYIELIFNLPGEDEKEVFYRAGIIIQAEHIFKAHEICTISALHDHFGYGIKRIKRLVDEVRKLRFCSPEDVMHMIDYMVAKGLTYSHEKSVLAVKKEVDFWKIGLRGDLKGSPCIQRIPYNQSALEILESASNLGECRLINESA